MASKTPLTRNKKYVQILEEHNERRAKLSMVLFNDALEHLTRVHRTLRMQRGHALVIGVGGSGRRSTIKLASFAADCELFEIAPSRGYDELAFREDMKVSTAFGILVNFLYRLDQFK